MILGFLFAHANAQSPTLYWQHYYGGSQIEFFGDMQKTFDNGFVIVGQGNSVDGDFTGNISNGGIDWAVVRVDACGTKLWTKLVGGNSQDLFPVIRQTIDRGSIIIGATFSTNLPNGYHGGTEDGLVCKLDSNGNTQWIKTFGGSKEDVLLDAISLPDTTFIVAGWTTSTDFDGSPQTLTKTGWLLKLDKTGNVIWKNFYGNISSCNDIQYANDGGLIIAGTNTIGGDVNLWLLKIDIAGNKIWEKSYGGTADDRALVVKSTGANNYIVLGRSSSTNGDVTVTHGGDDIWVLKIDNNGNLIWQKTFGGSANEMPRDIIIMPNNNIVFDGYSNSSDGDVGINHGLTDACVFSLDSTGLLLWTKVYGGSKRDEFYGLAPGVDNSIVLSGFTASADGDVQGNHLSGDFLLLKLRDIVSKKIDTFSCKSIRINNTLITHDTAFTVNLKDICNYDSASIEYNITIKHISIHSIADITINRGERITLSTISTDPVIWTGSGLDCYACTSPVAFPLYLSNTYIAKTSNGSCSAMDTVIVNVKIIDTLFIPSAFSPNNDGINDLFRVVGTVNDFSMKIFNRWGQTVFLTNSIHNGWDGKFKNTSHPNGVFVYSIRYRTQAGKFKQLNGTLTLIR